MRKQQFQSAPKPVVNGNSYSGLDADTRLTPDAPELDCPEPRLSASPLPSDYPVQPDFLQFLKERLPRYHASTELRERIRKEIADMRD